MELRNRWQTQNEDTGKAQLVKLILAMLVLFFNYFLNNDYLALIVTGYICFDLLTGKEENTIPTLLFTTSFSFIFHFGNYEMFEFVCIAGVARLLMRDTDVFKDFFFLQPFYLLTHFWSTELGHIKLGQLVPITALMCFFYASHTFDESNRDRCYLFFISGHLLSGILGFFRDQTRIVTLLGTDYVGEMTRFSGLAYDCNFLAMTSVVILCYLFFKAQGYTPIVWLTMTGLTLVMGAMTYSKSFYLCCAPILLYAMLKQRGKMRKYLMVFYLLAAAAALLFHEQIGSSLEVILGRFGSIETMDDLTTGRYSLWIMYLSKQFVSVKSTFFGTGWNVTDRAAHNLLLQILSQFGIIGTLTDILYFYMCYSKIVGRRRLGGDSICTLLLVAMLLFNLSAYTNAALWANLFILLLIVSEPEKRPKPV